MLTLTTRLRIYTLHLVFVYLGQISSVAALSGLDIITMKNGDLHHGTAAQPIFTLITDYGEISIPYLHMKALVRARKSESDIIFTQAGERFSGIIKETEVVILRDHQPMLPLLMRDIADISFNYHSIGKSKTDSPDSIQLNNGDYFFTAIHKNDLYLKNESGIHEIPFQDIYFIDFSEQGSDKSNNIQISLNDGNIIQGLLINKDIFQVNTRYKQKLSIASHLISALAYQVNFNGQLAGFNYRRRINPASFLQDRMVDGELGPAMVIMRGGKYLKGDLQGDGDSDERPAVINKLKPFAIGLHEVTFEQYDRFCEDTQRVKPPDSGWGRGKRPVINVSWHDAVAFTRWLSRKTRKNYRLPSDSEWEYAARAGSKTRFWWGNEMAKARANCEGCGSLWDGEKTAPVERFRPNHFGLHDTAGNVFEWVADCLDTDFSKAPVDGRPIDRGGCGKRIIRGGAWSFPADESRSANRWRDFPSRKSDDTGFRLARDLP